MDRRRTSVTSTSTIRSARETSMQVKNLRSPSVGSLTPKLEEDDDGKPRRTRGRNPLPPTTGPLFPPLPPKQPKNSPKNSPQAPSRSPAVRTPIPQSSSALAAPPEIIPRVIADITPIDSTALEEDAISARSVSPEKVHVPSASNASLTPPPPTSEDTVAEGEEKNELIGDEDQEEKVDDEWDSYRKHRIGRAFGESNNAGEIEIKEEPGLEELGLENGNQDEDGKDEETPIKTRSSKLNGNGFNKFPGSGENTPLATTPLSNTERAGSASRQTRKRRGEDELLLDDHLLPVEIRRTSFSAKKPKKEKEVEKVEEVEQAIEDEEDVPDLDDETSNHEDEDEEEEEEEVKDVTRCVCHKVVDIDTMMIQCDKCNVWQHGECMGIWGDEEAPDEYFCEECKPERHQALLKWIRRQGRKSGTFIPPLPENLRNLHNDRDDYPPSQSKRWAEEIPEEPQEPTPPPPKPPSRSHHKRETTSPIADAHDGRRNARGRQSASSITREKPPSASNKLDNAKGHPAKVTTSGRRARGISSVSPDRDSSSPQPNSAREPKKRSTMNSRDSAYEEAVKAALEASKAEVTSPMAILDGSTNVEDKEKDRGEKRRREDEEEVEDKERVKKGRRKRDEEEDSVKAIHSQKHELFGRYTYQSTSSLTASQAPVIAPSPARRPAASTPVPPAPPAHHEHGTRRAGALAAAPVVYHPLSVESANHLSWWLPEHLSAFADLLPSTNPNALEVPAPKMLGYLPRNHYHNQRYGPFTEERDENGKLVLPKEPSGREVAENEKATLLDPPVRPRYPPKRITTAEMKKRVRNVLEYVGRVQIEEGKRQERARLLGIKNIKLKTTETDGTVNVNVDVDGDVNMDEQPKDVEANINITTNDSPMPEQTKSMQLMDELTRDLINFQECFNSNGFTSPIPPTTATFSNGSGIGLPPTPSLPTESTLPAPAVIPTPTPITIPTPVPVEVASTDLDAAPIPSTEVRTDTESVNTLKEGILEGIEILPLSEPQPEIISKEIIEGEGLDVYKQGIVNTVITTEEEKEVAEKVEGIVAQAEAEIVA
ncbi:uncharacterized protein L201_003375 [Kwoniella dendrophila CBS 6074]|uniref:PHD-type domain-containing protein n=1 Tax=Kwoniella dendrophila CBS 6074 TaxID=1295534 RepID=A0AAX4JUI2_9TREE